MIAESQVVVLAGGLATRLGELARARPKLLAPVAGRPFADWLLAKLRSCGFAEVVLCVGHLGEAIRKHVGDGRRFGALVRYVDDGPTLLGTGGALRKATAHHAPPFLGPYGDSYLPFDYQAPLRDLRAHPESLGTLAVYRNEGRWDRSNVRLSGDHVAEYRPSTHPQALDRALSFIDYGAMALRRDAVLRIPPGQPYGLAELQAGLARQRLLRAYRAQQRFYEIGSPGGLADLSAEFAAHPTRYPHSTAEPEVEP